MQVSVYDQVIFAASNTTHSSVINWEQFPMGVIYILLTAMSCIWLLSLRGIFKNQILLQRQLFVFISLNFLSRGIQLAIFHQFCFRDKFHDGSQRPDYCYYIDRLSMNLDLLGSVFNFTIYSILVSFWAEKYYGMKRDRGGLHWFIGSNDLSLEKIRKRINIWFWCIQVIAYGIVIAMDICVWAVKDNKFFYMTTAYQYSRLATRILLSMGISIGLLVYGVKMYQYFKVHINTQRNLSKVAYVTLICGTCYVLLSISNIFTTVFYDKYSRFNYSWIFFNVFSSIEIFANLMLLLSLTPRSILNALGYLKCWNSASKVNAAVINSESTPLDSKYIDDFDYRTMPFSQTYLDNYEYSDEYSDATDDESSSIQAYDDKYYSG